MSEPSSPLHTITALLTSYFRSITTPGSHGFSVTTTIKDAVRHVERGFGRKVAESVHTQTGMGRMKLVRSISSWRLTRRTLTTYSAFPGLATRPSRTVFSVFFERLSGLSTEAVEPSSQYIVSSNMDPAPQEILKLAELLTVLLS